MSWKRRKLLREKLENEAGYIVKDWGGKVSVALVFPNTYFTGMSNLGFQSVYRLFNALPDVVCERFFYPDSDTFPLLSLESHRPLSEFDFIVFSIPFEMDYPHVIEILIKAGIPIRQKDRTINHPLIAAGGVTTFLNPQPLSPFMDFFFLGDAEIFVHTFWNFWRSCPFTGAEDKQDWLSQLARSVEGVYVPSLYYESYNSDGTLKSLSPVSPDLPTRIRVQKSSLVESEPARTQIFTPNTEFSNAFLVEIGRGCGRGCRFCAAGYVYRPPRFHKLDTVLKIVPDKAFPKRWGLVSAAVGDYPYLEELARFLIEKGVEVSFSSLRADGIHPVMKEIFKASRHHAVAIAPEAGSERLRRVINKKLTDDQICEACAFLTEAGIRHLKLYFMIGLPTETDEDIDAIVSLVKRIRHEVIRTAKGVKNLGTIVVDINSFVPKPFTPFQWAAFDGVSSLKEKAKKIQRLLSGFSNLRVHTDVPKWAYLQALFARGDQRVGDLLEKVVKNGISWTVAFREVPWNPDFFVMRERRKDEKFPWEIVDHGIDREFLWKEYEKALNGKESGGCPSIGFCFNSNHKCNICGVCKSVEQT